MERPTLDKKETLAERYEAGEEVSFEIEKAELDYEVRTCHHSAGCPCGGKPMVAKVEMKIFEDGSVFMDDIVSGSFRTQELAEEAAIEADYEAAMEPPDDYDHYRDL